MNQPFPLVEAANPNVQEAENIMTMLQSWTFEQFANLRIGMAWQNLNNHTWPALNVVVPYASYLRDGNLGISTLLLAVYGGTNPDTGNVIWPTFSLFVKSPELTYPDMWTSLLIDDTIRYTAPDGTVMYQYPNTRIPLDAQGRAENPVAADRSQTWISRASVTDWKVKFTATVDDVVYTHNIVFNPYVRAAYSNTPPKAAMAELMDGYADLLDGETDTDSTPADSSVDTGVSHLTVL